MEEHSIFHSYGLLAPLISNAMILLTHEKPDGMNVCNRGS